MLVLNAPLVPLMMAIRTNVTMSILNVKDQYVTGVSINQMTIKNSMLINSKIMLTERVITQWYANIVRFIR